LITLNWIILRLLDFSNNYAFIAGYNSNSLALVDLTVATAPVLAGSLVDGTHLSSPTSIKVKGDYAYLTSYGDNSLAIVISAIRPI